MSLLTVLITLKDGPDISIFNVDSFSYRFESNRYKDSGPLFVVSEAILDELDIVGENRHVFPLDIIDSIEVF